MKKGKRKKTGEKTKKNQRKTQKKTKKKQTNKIEVERANLQRLTSGSGQLC